MTRATLRARRREARRPQRVRAEGDVPGILYGGGVDPTPLRVPRTELNRLAAGGHVHGLVDLVIEGDGRPLPVLIREVQRDPVKGEVLHVDLLHVRLDKPITVTVPIRVTGAEALEKAGAVIQHQLDEIEISCLPADVPEALVVDVTRLGVGDSLRVGDITPPPGVTIAGDPDEIVLSVLAPRQAADEGAAEAGEAAEAKPAAEGEA